MPPIDEYEMEVTNEHGEISSTSIANAIACRTISDPPKLFGHLTSFQAAGQQSPVVNSIDWNSSNHLPAKRSTDPNNSNAKPSMSFFQKAKHFCGNMVKKPKRINNNNIELGLDEITNRMALLRFTSILDISAGF